MVGYYTLKNSTMKKIKNILLMVAVLATVMACDRDFESDDIALGVIRFPAIQLMGEPVVFVSQGGTYTDAGATASLGTDDITSMLETSTNLDLTKAGVYTVDYSVTNVNELGQESTVPQQRIVVVSPSNPNTAVDLSGTYARSTNAAPAVWTQVAPGVYRNDNIGGVLPPSIAVLPVYVFHYADGTIEIPEQPVPNGYGTLSAQITLNANGYSVVIDNVGFLTNTRTFIKQ
jgi:hypothetical protein